MAQGALKWVIYLISAGLIILGGLFLMAAFPPNEYRLLPGLAFIIVAIIILYVSRERRQIEIKQTVSVSGPIKLKEVRCPNCSASLKAEKLVVVDGKPFITCDYCGHNFEVTEEPTW